MQGNTSDKTTLKDFLQKVEMQYGKAQRIWVMDRGIPTEQTLGRNNMPHSRDINPSISFTASGSPTVIARLIMLWPMLSSTR
jgi:hypothetical protein